MTRTRKVVRHALEFLKSIDEDLEPSFRGDKVLNPEHARNAVANAIEFFAQIERLEENLDRLLS